MRKHEAKVDVDNMAVVVQKQVAVVTILELRDTNLSKPGVRKSAQPTHLKQVAQNRVAGHAFHEVALCCAVRLRIATCENFRKTTLQLHCSASVRDVP
jgi:hypothetical protein